MPSINKLILAVFGVGLLISGPALSATSTGRITAYHVNINSSTRGACIKMVPALPTIYACLPSRAASTPVYDQIHDLLLQAWQNGRVCTIFWTKLDSGGAQQIIFAECTI